MKELLRDTLIVALAWIMVSIPIWLTFHFYFMDVNQAVHTLETEARHLSDELQLNREKAESLWDSIEKVRQTYETDIPKLSAKMDSVLYGVHQSERRFSDQTDVFWNELHLLRTHGEPK